MGFANPFLIASTPAMKVVLTAPSPASTTPSFPFAGSIVTPLEIISTLPYIMERIFHHRGHGKHEEELIALSVFSVSSVVRLALLLHCDLGNIRNCAE